MNGDNIKINIPEGKVIDIGNSNFEKGIIVFRPKFITYEEIFNNITTQLMTAELDGYVRSKDIAKSRAFNKLVNIARFYNGPKWKPDWNNTNEPKYHIFYDNKNHEYCIRAQMVTTDNIGTIYFRHVKDAVNVTNNPELTPILDAIFKD